jgi:LAS superfamily LD-carboxypeptidase LdcB
MRIIEPYSYKAKNNRKSKSKKLYAVFGVFILAIIVCTLIFYKKSVVAPEASQSSAVLAEQSIKKDSKDRKIKYFSGEEFLKLYENIAYPNTQVLLGTPIITGDKNADKRIITIALSRGYALRSVPIAPIIKTKEPNLASDDLLQEKAYSAWLALKKDALKQNVPLKLNSGYRSVEMQRELFISRLKNTGVSVQKIASGNADSAVVDVLKQAALPGYSRHHTGYTVDLICGNGTQSFEVTSCFKWLSSNNYANAKKHGWIPSYPEGTDNQGPEPEAWEYVWVGKEAVLED